jgi:hypothetical protein
MSEEEERKYFRQEINQSTVKLCRSIDMYILQLLIKSHQQDKTKDTNTDAGK